MKPAEDGSRFINRGVDISNEPPSLPGWPNPAIDPDGAWWHFNPNPILGDASERRV